MSGKPIGSIVPRATVRVLWAVGALAMLTAATGAGKLQSRSNPSPSPATPNPAQAGRAVHPHLESDTLSPEDRAFADILARFASPPRSYSPVPIWWWSGERLDWRRLEWQMERMVEGHVYNTVILNLAPSGPLYGSAADNPPFFSAAWWSLVRRVLAKAQTLGMRIWLYDQLGFSTARIQDRLMEREPAWRAVELAVLEQDVVGPKLVRMAAPGRALAASAVELDKEGRPTGVVEDLSSSLQDGRLSRQLPAGRYRIMLFHEAPGGFDYMSPVAAGKLLNFVHGEFERKLKPYLGTTIPGTFQDELPPMNRWTREFLQEFRRRKGYDLRPLLPMLWYDIGPRTGKVRCDVADVQAQLLERAFFKPLYEWHRRHGMICAYDQMTRDADPVSANRYYVDYMRTMRWYQAPGNDQTGSSKPHSSLAHLYGRPRVWLEGFYNSGWGQTLEELSGRIHEFYAQGANLYNPHAWYYTTLGGWWEWAPPCTSFRQPYWQHYRLFSDYVTRLSFLLSRGAHVSDIAVLYPSSTVHAASTYAGTVSATGAKARDAYLTLCRELEQAGIDYDILDEASLRRGTIQSGFLRVGSERYRCVALPSVTAMSRADLRKLLDLARDGGIVAALGAVPSMATETGSDDPGMAAATSALFPPAQSAAIGQPRVQRIGKGMSLAEESNAAHLARLLAARVPPHASGVRRYLHRRIAGRDVYFLEGRGGQDGPQEVTLKGSGRAWVADPWTGSIHPVPSRPASPGRVTARVSFASSRALFVILSSKQLSAPSERIETKPKGVVWPASARVRVRPSTATPSAPAINLGDEWRVALAPTLDNRWGDFALPASADPVPVECRRFKCREETDEQNGVESEWYDPDHEDDDWQTVTAGYGLRWWISRADVGDKPLKMPGPDDGDWRPDPDVWLPAVFSLRSGIEKDSIYNEWLGPKGRVPDNFLDFGTAPAGTVRFAVTFVHVPTACDALIRCGAGDARVAVNGRWLPAGNPVPVRLLAGYNAVAAQFRHAGSSPLRTYVHIGRPDAAMDEPAWIWTDRTSDISDCYARRTFDLKSRPDWAAITVSADNGYELYVNGTRIGREIGNSSAQWSVAERYPVERYLRPGRNVIAIHGMNLGGPAGIVAILRYGARGDPAGQTIMTDSAWRVIRAAPAGWVQIGFDDAPWSHARVVGVHPCEPWGVVDRLTRTRPAILPGSAWLNRTVLPWVPDLVIDPLPGIHKRVGWYRFRTPPGTRQMIVPTAGRFNVWIAGRACEVTDGNIVEVPLDLQEHSQVAAIRIEQPAGRYGGAAFDSPVRFTVGVGAMKTGDWTKLGLPHYSGGVRYVQEITIPASYVGAPLMLDLGRVRGTAQVTVNDKPAGVRIWRPYRFDVTDLLKAGLNRIEVTVFNTLAPQFGAGYPTPYVFAGQEASGLFGPVRITGPPAPPPPQPSLSGLTNVALASRGAVATASSEHPSGQYLADTVIAGLTTGERWARGGGWNDGTEGEFPDWIEVALPSPVEIRAVKIITLDPAERYGIRDFDVEVRHAGDWVTVAEVRDNASASVVVGVPGIRSDRVRILVRSANDEMYSRIVAIAVYAPEHATDVSP